MLREDTSAAYQEFTSFADPLGTLDEARAVPSLDIRDPQAGTFSLEVFGRCGRGVRAALARRQRRLRLRLRPAVL